MQFDKGIATICGDRASIADIERTARIAGNMQGVEFVDVAGLIAPVPESQEMWKVIYRVVERAIAKQRFGESYVCMIIFNVNKGLLSDPNIMYSGQKIRIPLNNNSE